MTDDEIRAKLVALIERDRRWTRRLGWFSMVFGTLVLGSSGWKFAAGTWDTATVVSTVLWVGLFGYWGAVLTQGRRGG